LSGIKKGKHKYLEEINDAILRQIPINTTNNISMVLDVGCGMGALAEAMQNKGYIVWGIDINEEAAQIAAERIAKVINADLTDIASIKEEIGNQCFDYLVFADILEHTYDPLTILKEYLTFLNDDGHVLVSLPNTVAWTKRIKFLLGKFEYTDTGIMDRDHIRFFTFKTAKRLVTSAGYSVVKVDYVPYFIRIAQPIIKKILLKGEKAEDTDRRQLLDSPYYRWYMKYINPVEYILGYFCKSLFAFKMIIVGKKL
jgi:2-polyprenyl-3-methyl-5-hydroxy-6-metoxy-1,4-benzoquinol methylase